MPEGPRHARCCTRQHLRAGLEQIERHQARETGQVVVGNDRVPVLLEGGAHEPEKVEGKEGEDRVGHGRQEDEGNDPPPFAGEHG